MRQKVMKMILLIVIFIGVVGITKDFIMAEEIYKVYGDYKYAEYTNEIEIKAYTGTGGEVSIPDAINGKPVTSIASFAFYHIGQNITAINIPDSVEAFGKYAFYGASVTKLKLPKSMRIVDPGAFSFCKNLQAFELDSDNKYFSIQDGILYNYAKTRVVCCPAGKTGNYKMPETVSLIEEYAFDGAEKITSITLNDKIEKISWAAFACCKGLTEFNIPNSVIEIDAYAFSECINLKSVNIPEGVTKLGKFAFEKCENLSEVYLPSTLETMGESVFEGCESLCEITIPKKVTGINGDILYGCANLQNIYAVEDSENYVSVSGVLYSKDKTSLICFPCGREGTVSGLSEVQTIGEKAFYFCKKISKIILPEGLKEIGKDAFYGCESLSEIILPESVTGKISAFSGCKSLKNIKIPEGVTVIGSFAKCTDLQYIILPLSMNRFSARMPFEDCKNLKDIYYAGTKEQWYEIVHYNVWIPSCTVHFNSNGPASDTDENVDNTNGDTQKNISIQRVKISAPSAKLAAGKKVKLSASVFPINASNKKLKWSSSNKKYATVNQTGRVTLKSAGAGRKVTITAIAQDGSNKKATYKITIMKHSVKSVKIKAPAKTVKAGKSLQLKAVVKTTGTKVNKDMVWSTSNKKYAAVDKKGKVKTKKAGKGKSVTITAKSTDGSNKKATIKLKIK